MVKIAPKLTDDEFVELVRLMSDARATAPRGRLARPRRKLRHALPVGPRRRRT